MVNEKMEAALNAQLNAEVYSGYLQAAEELEHGMKFYDYIIRRGASVTLTAIEAPQTEWESPLAAFEHVLSHEQMVTGLINDLVDLAIEEKDHATNNFLQWFVEEQVEEEENAMENLAKLKLAGDDNSLLYKLNEEFAGRGTAE